MTRSPRRCLLAAGLAAMVLPMAPVAAGAADTPYVDRPVTGGGAVFPGPTAPRSRLLVEPPPAQRPAPAPVQRQAPRQAPSKAQPISPKTPEPPETKPEEVPEAEAEAPSSVATPAPVPARKDARVAQPAPSKPAVPGAATPPPAPAKPETPAKDVAAKPEVKPEAPKAVTTGSAPDGGEQAASGAAAAVPEPPPLPDLPPARPAEAPAPETSPQAEPAVAEPGAGNAGQPAQQASLPPSGAEDGDVLTVAFAPDVAEPPNSATDTLEALAARLESRPSLRLRLNAYAPGTEAEESRSRRLSLSRALAVRSRLVEAGISSTRIEVRALGNAAPEGSPDRVDIIVLER